MLMSISTNYSEMLKYLQNSREDSYYNFAENSMIRTCYFTYYSMCNYFNLVFFRLYLILTISLVYTSWSSFFSYYSFIWLNKG